MAFSIRRFISCCRFDGLCMSGNKRTKKSTFFTLPDDLMDFCAWGDSPGVRAVDQTGYRYGDSIYWSFAGSFWDFRKNI